MPDTLEAQRAAAIQETYPATTERTPSAVVTFSPLIRQFAAFSVLFAHGGDKGLIEGIRYGAELIAPSAGRVQEFVREAFYGGLLLPHPSTSVNAFIWVEESAELGDGIYPERVRFMAPGTGSLVSRMEALGDSLRSSLALDRLYYKERQELASLAQDLVAEEAVRFLRFELVRHRLVDPAGEHLEKLKTISERGSKHFSLGQLNRLAFMARSKAVNWHERNPKVGKSRATAHAINHFGNLIDDVLSGTRNAPDVHGREDDHDLSAATLALFGFILDADPLRTTPDNLESLLEGMPASQLQSECDLEIEDHSELVDWMRVQSGLNPQLFRAALENVADDEFELCIPGCAHERVKSVAEYAGRSFDRLVTLIGEQNAALAVAETMAVGNVDLNRGRSGDLALKLALEQLGFVPEIEDFEAH